MADITDKIISILMLIGTIGFVASLLLRDVVGYETAFLYLILFGFIPIGAGIWLSLPDTEW